MSRNAERNAEIVALRRAGNWPFEIARELKLSRNVVLGVLNRAGLCNREVDRSACLIDRKYYP